MTAYDRRSGEGFLRNLVVREGRRTGQLQVRLVTGPGRARPRRRWPRVAGPDTSVLWTQIDSVAETTQGGETELLAGERQARRGARAVRLRISPQAFLQTNTEMAEQLYGVAIEYASSPASSASTTCTAGSARSGC